MSNITKISKKPTLINASKKAAIINDRIASNNRELINDSKKAAIVDDNIDSNNRELINDSKKAATVDDNIASNNKKNKRINNGKEFEKLTSIENELVKNNYKKTILNKKTKFGYYYEKDNIVYVTQSGFKTYFQHKFSVDFGNVTILPDEAFIIKHNDTYHIKILEKKNQNVEGSVIEKLQTGGFKVRFYKDFFQCFREFSENNKFKIYYAYTINEFLERKLNTSPYNLWYKLLDEDNINIFYGDKNDYFETIFEWLNQLSD